jgi:hypothetical protein
VHELAKLVDAQTVLVPFVLDRVVRSAPAHDAGERGATMDRWPRLKHYGLGRRNPLAPARRESAAGLPNVLPDGHELIVPVKEVRQTKFVPHLAEPWVDVQEYAPSSRGQDVFLRYEAHDVDEKWGVIDALEHRGTRESHRLAIIVQQERV